MSMMYCEYHDKHIDTDWEAEHFDDNGDCVEKIVEDMKEAGKTDEEIEKYLEG